MFIHFVILIARYSIAQRDAGEFSVFKLVLAINNPRRVIFLRCTKTPMILPCTSDTTAGVMPDVKSYEQYECWPISPVDDTEVGFQGIDDIMVVEDVAFKTEGVHVRGREVSFEEFIRYHPKAVKKGDGAQKKGGKSVISDDILRQLQVMFPWMSIEELKEIASKKEVKVWPCRTVSAGGALVVAQTPDVVVVPDDVMASLAKELQEKKDELDEAVTATYFKVRVLGGEWSASKKGQAVSDIGCYPKNRDVTIWCIGVGFPRAKSFSVRRYGHQGAHALAEGWCHKGDWFFGRWQDLGCPGGLEWGELQAAYMPSSSFSDWFAGVPVETPAFQAGMMLANFVPNPVPE